MIGGICLTSKRGGERVLLLVIRMKGVRMKGVLFPFKLLGYQSIPVAWQLVVDIGAALPLLLGGEVLVAFIRGKEVLRVRPVRIRSVRMERVHIVGVGKRKMERMRTKVRPLTVLLIL